MGIRLIVEVLDHWQDAGLTPGERWDLLVLAENANDGTRLTFGPVHAQHILDRANKSPKGWKNAITALMRKKVITTHVPGRIKQVAVYHLEHLCPDPPHSGHKGMCAKPEKAVRPQGDPGLPNEGAGATPSPEEGHPAGDPFAGEGHPAGDPLGQEGHPAGAERVTQQVTPTPPYSSFKDSPRTTSSSSSVAEDSSDLLPAEAGEAEGGGGGDLSSEEQDQNHEQAEAFVDSLDYRGGQPGKKQRQKLITLAGAALAAGWTENGLRRYLDISDDPTVRFPASIYEYRLAEDELPLAAAPEAQTAPHLPPACETCLAHNPAAEFNAKFRTDYLSFHGGPCPRCHPGRPVSAADRGVAQGMALAAKYRQQEMGGTDARVQQALEAGRRLQAAADGQQPASHNAGVIARHRARQQNGHTPYSNEKWKQPADPAAAAKIPHCGDPNCDPTTRLKDGTDDRGLPYVSVCGDCHPSMRF